MTTDVAATPKFAEPITPVEKDEFEDDIPF